jgi:hypothetical protein
VHLARTAAAAVAALTLAACQDSGTGVQPEQPAPSFTAEGYTTRGPVETGWITGRDGQPMEVVYEVQHGHAIWEGDIDLGPVEWIARTEEEVRSRRNDGVRYGVVRDGSTYRWPNGVVPYVIQSSLPNKARVTDAMAHIVANTNKISFVQRTTQANYVEFRTSTGCSSSVGRVGGRQYVNLADGCSTGNTIHEILHALGMFHEQTRCDRDSFVTIHTANITSGYENNFTKQCTNATDYSSYAEGSIMHYGPFAFSKNGLATISSKRGLDSQMGQRSGMNSTDRSTMNTIYP